MEVEKLLASFVLLHQDLFVEGFEAQGLTDAGAIGEVSGVGR